MDLKIKGVAVLTAAFGASGDLIPDILIGTKSLPNQGLLKVAGLNPVSFRSVRHYSRRQTFVAGTAGVYTFDPNVSTTISAHSMRFNTMGFDALRPNSERNTSSVLVSVSANEALTNEQYCDRIVSSFAGNKFFSATRSGSGASAVVLLTERYIISPYSKYPAIANLGVTNAPAGSTFSKTTETVAQKGYTGAEVNMMLEEPRIMDIKPFVPNGVDAAANYDVYEITFDRRAVTAPFDFSHNEPYKYVILVKTNATNASVFETKMNALFDINSSDFIPYNSSAVAAVVAADTIAQPAEFKVAEGDPIRFTAVSTVTGITTSAIVFAVDVTDTTFKVSATNGGSAINLGGSDGNVEFGLAWYEGDATADTLLAIPSTSGDAVSA